MNANALWAGNDYAYVEGRGRGQQYSPSAKRVRVIRVFPKKNSYYAERATTMVEAEFLTDNGEPRLWTYGQNVGQPIVREIRARDIINHWNEYAEMREYRKAQAAKIEEERQEQLRKEQRDRERVIDAIELKGIERNAVLRVSYGEVCLDRDILESWLGLDAQE